MFSSQLTKEMATTLRHWWPKLYVETILAFQSAAVGTTQEVKFFRKLLQEFRTRFANFSADGLQITSRVAEVHRKPIVQTGQFRCELADLLVTVKFRLGGSITERKSILYQVKMCKANTLTATIDQNQLTLLTDWPQFQFGRLANGKSAVFNIEPHTTEFGSYLIAQRGPKDKGWLRTIPFPWFCYPSYGLAPSALTVKREGPNGFNCESIPEPCSDVCNIVRQLVFEIGEPHAFNAEVQRLVDSLYRYVGLSSDPPNEFDKYTRETGEDEIGFAVVEFVVSTEKRG
jgi:hypothetical protein